MQLCTILTAILAVFQLITCNAATSKLFRVYIGAESKSIKLSHVPINSNIDFHFILAFAIDYTTLNNPSPTNGKFKPFWASHHITPHHISSIKHKNPNVKIALSIGGDSIGKKHAFFAPKSVKTWLHNAISSLTKLINHYHIDGLDIDYEHFKSSPNTFAECIGRLIMSLKKNGTISFSSIAPYEDRGEVETNYITLWKKYGDVIDYVNFQFYAYDKMGVWEFVKKFNEQGEKYGGGKILGSFITDGSKKGLSPDDGFFEACNLNIVFII